MRLRTKIMAGPNSLEKDGGGDECEAKVEVGCNDVKYATVWANGLHHGLPGDKA